jgi:hypothetical protein
VLLWCWGSAGEPGHHSIFTPRQTMPLDNGGMGLVLLGYGVGQWEPQETLLGSLKIRIKENSHNRGTNGVKNVLNNLL